MILTAEADSLPTELLHGYGLVGCHSSRTNDLSVPARIIHHNIFDLWETKDGRNGHAAIFEVKFGELIKRARERSAEQLVDDL